MLLWLVCDPNLHLPHSLGGGGTPAPAPSLGRGGPSQPLPPPPATDRAAGDSLRRLTSSPVAIPIPTPTGEPGCSGAGTGSRRPGRIGCTVPPRRYHGAPLETAESLCTLQLGDGAAPPTTCDLTPAATPASSYQGAPQAGEGAVPYRPPIVNNPATTVVAPTMPPTGQQGTAFANSPAALCGAHRACSGYGSLCAEGTGPAEDTTGLVQRAQGLQRTQPALYRGHRPAVGVPVGGQSKGCR